MVIFDPNGWLGRSIWRFRALFLLRGGGRTRRLIATALLLVPYASFITTSQAIADTPSNSWQSTPTPMTTSHMLGGSTKLLDGRIMVVSGIQQGNSLTSVTDLYDPVAKTWSASGPVNQPRAAFSNAITLNNGKILIAGGTDATASNDYSSAELYDPSTGTWSYTGSLNTPRRYPTAVKLADGRVLLAAGAHGVPDGNRFLSSAEIYDPSTGTWSYTGQLPLAREGNDAGVLMQDGRVMLLGGEGPWLTNSPEVEIYDPATNAWSETGSLPHGIGAPTLTLLQDGHILLAGGGDGGVNLAEAEIYDPAAGTWSSATSMNHARAGARAVLMSNGSVLVSGGSNGTSATLTSEIYDPVANTWTDDAVMQSPQISAYLTTVSDGVYLMAGGYDGSNPSAQAEVYGSGAQPPVVNYYDALGDSFSSGDGAPPYNDPTCRVSGNSFPIFLQAGHPDLHLTAPSNLACTGAKTSDLASQIGFLTIHNNAHPVSLVTVTVGGDDIGFGNVLSNCYYAVGKASVSGGSDAAKAGKINNACKKAQQSQVDKAIANLPTNLMDAYQKIHAAAPQARIIVAGYPDIFPQSPPASCDMLPQESVAWLSQESSSLNDTIAQSVMAANTGGKAEFVDSLNLLQDHTVCSPTPWVNPLNEQTVFDFWQNGPQAHAKDAFDAVLKGIQNSPFHPNQDGYQAWADAIHTYLVNHP